MRRHLSIPLALAAVTLPRAVAAQAEKPFSVVLVHGAFVDASGWRATSDLLTARGYEVLVVQNPTASLTGDVEASARAIRQARHPVILVGHSYGGAVITEAGNDPKVHSLVYLAAFVPDAGESVFELATKEVAGEPGAPLLPPSDGYLVVDPAKFPAAFAADVDPSLTRFMAASQVPWGLAAVQARVGAPAWKTKPTFVMVATEDRMVRPTTQRMMARRTGGTVVEIASSHAVMLRHPRKVADFIVRAQ